MPASLLYRTALVLAMLTVMALREAPIRGAVPQYTITNLGTLPDTTHSHARRINARGTVLARAVGVGETSFLWRDGVQIPLDPTGSGYPRGIAINDADQVVGSFDVEVGGRLWSHAFLWNEGVLTDLGTLGLEESHPADINNAGQVVGTAIGFECQGTLCVSNLFKAFLWSGSPSHSPKPSTTCGRSDR